MGKENAPIQQEEEPTMDQVEDMTREEIKRRSDELISAGFTDYHLDRSQSDELQQLNKLLDDAKKKGWEIESISDGEVVHLFIKEL